MAGIFTSNQDVILQNVILPEFHRMQTVQEIVGHVFLADCWYDMNFCHDFLQELGIVLDFHDKIVSWDDSSISMRPFVTLLKSSAKDNLSVAEHLCLDTIEQGYVNDNAFIVSDYFKHSNFSSQNIIPPLILDSIIGTAADNHQGYKMAQDKLKPSLYEQVDVDTVMQNCLHLSTDHQADLSCVLLKYKKLLSGQLGYYTGGLVHLDIDPSAPPHCLQAFDVPGSQLQIFKTELD
ncbi:hypothetical protein ACA910_015743 [Epithemia clementina (nom. ined.)]